MKIFKIEDRRGWVALPERIAGYSFPLSFGSIEGATSFPFKSVAQKIIKKYNLFSAHVEELDFND